MCLAVFMALVYFKDLKWYYGAEVLCIVIVQWIVGFISLARTYKVRVPFFSYTEKSLINFMLFPDFLNFCKSI